MTSRLGAELVTVGYGGEPVVRDLTLDVPDGLVTTIVGPNGCGKSTLLRTLARLLKPTSGRVRLDGGSIDAVPTREVSRRLALLPQSPIAPDGLLVRDLVGRGRHPHQRWFRQWSAEDEEVVDLALRLTDTWELRDRALDQLSGGQCQRAWVAMTLAQDTDLVLLDEPTTFLDLAHQVEVLDLVSRLNRERGRTVAMVLHDLNLAARYSDLVVVMKDGEVVGQGAPREVLTVDRLRDVFGLTADVRRCWIGWRPGRGTGRRGCRRPDRGRCRRRARAAGRRRAPSPRPRGASPPAMGDTHVVGDRRDGERRAGDVGRAVGVAFRGLRPGAGPGGSGLATGEAGLSRRMVATPSTSPPRSWRREWRGRRSTGCRRRRTPGRRRSPPPRRSPPATSRWRRPADVVISDPAVTHGAHPTPSAASPVRMKR